MPLIAVGTPIMERLTFNSGYIDFGNGSDGYKRIIDIQNVSVEITFVQKELRRLNSIKLAAHKRATTKVSLRAKTSSVNKEILLDVMGEEATEILGGRTIDVYDGQPSGQTVPGKNVAVHNDPVFTTYIDDNIKLPIQFQLSDAIITTSPFTTSLEEFGSVDITITAKDISVFEYTYYKNTIGGNITLEVHA